MKRLFFIIICLCIGTIAFAQQDDKNSNPWVRPFSPEAFNQQLDAFVQKEADLTPQECQKFFPLMHEMMNKQREIGGKIQYTIGLGFSAKTEADYEKIISWITDLEVESKKIEQTYYKKKFHSVLSWKKIHKVRTALQRFNMEALRHFSPQNNNRRRWGYPKMQYPSVKQQGWNPGTNNNECSGMYDTYNYNECYDKCSANKNDNG